MTANGFYSKNSDGFLTYAANAVYGPTFTLLKEDKDSYIYPVEGWWWFDSREDAIQQLNPFPIPIGPDRDKKNIKDIISYNQLMSRFTEQETGLLNVELETNAALFKFMDSLKRVDQINVKNRDVIEGIGYLSRIGIIDPNRIIELLVVSK